MASTDTWLPLILEQIQQLLHRKREDNCNSQRVMQTLLVVQRCVRAGEIRAFLDDGKFAKSLNNRISRFSINKGIV